MSDIDRYVRERNARKLAEAGLSPAPAPADPLGECKRHGRVMCGACAIGPDLIASQRRPACCICTTALVAAAGDMCSACAAQFYNDEPAR